MRRRPVDSAAIVSVGYDGAHAVLELEFVDGDVYRYFLVPASVHADLLAAPSLGRFFTEQIRNDYACEKV